jgi:hypothetical protein
MIIESEFFSNTVVNGKNTENIHLVSLAQNGNVVVKGNINDKPISILRYNKPPSTHSRKMHTRKRVKFVDNQSVSAMDSMPNPFEPTVVYRKKTKRKKQHRKTQKRNSK